MLPFLDETDELFNYWILRALLLVVLYLAWRSTYVREDRPSSQDAVLAIENNLRRLNTLPLRRLNTQHNVTTIILRSSSQQSNISNVTETEGLDLENDSIASSIDNITQSILTEASESATGLDLSDTEGYPSVVRPAVVVDTFHDAGPEEIIRQMDATDQDGGSRPSTITDNTAGTPSSSELRQRRRPPTAGNEPNAAALPERAGTASALETVTADSATGSDVKPIRIKLKYLNDDSKLVEGNLNEGIGEFKRRNFTLELAAQKLVRLVFNGHVLQPDTKTLAACGLFDNCVVHCLIHNQKSSLNGGDRAQDGGTVSGDNRFQIAAGDSANDGGNSENGNENADNREANGHPNESTRSRTRYGTYFIHIGTLAVTVLILYGWYCRFHYGHLFNMSSTIGLIATTTTFLIMMPTIILADSNTPN
ncbi:transmembrane and ubiquitin-like domain-containing protein 2 [Anopheles aquasalis]|uniref:transmembrane and ubiquitin-like domain-containing protein 2 n=1 Tax=Anopheles aquasalis TaxID=42839 RepID=UPI00215B15A5|nr:transmembrane and ubiquitin-like domain-containing protein 2 [Anopheles aquasalis]XP_050096745.1 transmembrane and ubiquitin-like domain-containing protein 2 [Anopheles aquasalis]